jgi:hypothetical protein
MEQSEPVLNVADLKQFLPCTCNLDPYLNKLIRGRILSLQYELFSLNYSIESAAYFYMNNSDESGFINNDPARFFPPHDST